MAHCGDHWHIAMPEAGAVHPINYARMLPLGLHVLPDGFQRIRHYGLPGNRGRQLKLARCRELLGASPPPAPVLALLADPRDRYQVLTGRSLRICPVCSIGVMQCIEVLPATLGHPHACRDDTS